MVVREGTDRGDGTRREDSRRADLDLILRLADEMADCASAGDVQGVLLRIGTHAGLLQRLLLTGGNLGSSERETIASVQDHVRYAVAKLQPLAATLEEKAQAARARRSNVEQVHACLIPRSERRRPRVELSI